MPSTKITVLVASHKDYDFPEDHGYMPIQVGALLAPYKLKINGDDLGHNISYLNKSFCELTGLFWLWKNHNSAVYGLVHYRRYFRSSTGCILVRGKKVASTSELLSLLDKAKIILPKPRNYWIQTVWDHYAFGHHETDLLVVRGFLSAEYPDYLDAWDYVMDGTSISLYNMFIMRAEMFESYCDWLFHILFEIEKKIPYKDYGPYQSRVFGFVAERLLNVWVCKNISKHQIKYLPVINLEGENLFKKAYGMIKRRITNIRQI